MPMERARFASSLFLASLLISSAHSPEIRSAFKASYGIDRAFQVSRQLFVGRMQSANLAHIISIEFDRQP